MEELRQYVWQHRLWQQPDMHTVDGRKVHVIDPGTINRNSGPDFFNAKIKIGGEMWVGNVEIHVRASDWMRHNHHTDPAYDSVILHVVGHDDLAVNRSNGERIPQLHMPCTRDFASRFQELVNNRGNELACSANITSVPPVILKSWIDSLAYQRLYTKTDRINGLIHRFNGDWEEACYVTVARAFGFGINSEPFERLALSLPLRFMHKHCDSLLSLEALLFGQAGFLDQDCSDRYMEQMQTEYKFLSHKFSIKRPDSLGWKMSRMRPANFPHRRIAMLAAMLEGGFRLLRDITEARNADDITALFNKTMTGYWATRYNFGPDCGNDIPGLSRQSLNTLLINVAVPICYAYGLAHDNQNLCDNALTLLHETPAENNSIIRMFTHAGVECNNAFTSQALIELRRSYCETRKCLYCRIGHRILSSKVKP